MKRAKQMFCFLVVVTMLLVLMLVNLTNFMFPFRTMFSFSNGTKKSDGLHIVSNYPLMYESPWKDSQMKPNISLMKERQMEIEDVLRKNLDHPLVEKVHLLVDGESAEKRLRNLPFGINKHKLIVKRTNIMPRWRHFWSYASDNLLNRLVVVTNMDIYLGEGFEKLNRTFLVHENAMYALSRHGRNETRCNMKGHCGFTYIGAHDAYLSLYTKPISESVLAELDFEMHLYGSENVLLWIFKNRLGKKLLNPCKDLKIYHMHCVDIRSARKIKDMHKKWGKDLLIGETGMYS